MSFYLLFTVNHLKYSKTMTFTSSHFAQSFLNFISIYYFAQNFENFFEIQMPSFYSTFNSRAIDEYDQYCS